MPSMYERFLTKISENEKRNPAKTISIKRLLLAAMVALTCTSAHATTVISSGGTYSGLVASTSSTSASDPAINITTTSPVTIENSIIEVTVLSGYGITAPQGAQVNVQNCTFIYSGTGASIAASATMFYVYNASSVTIAHSTFQGNAQGILVTNSSSAHIAIAQNQFEDNWNAIQIAYCEANPYIAIYTNLITQTQSWKHNDQISIYNSSGVPGALIDIQNNCVVANPDAPQQVNSADIQPGDTNDSYVQVVSNLCLNGGGEATGAFNANNDTDQFNGNTLVGIGYTLGISYGLGIWPMGGTWSNNLVAWWDWYDQRVRNFYPQANMNTNGNVGKEKGYITLANEEALYNQWWAANSSQGIGNGNTPIVQFPDPSDFNF
jgi:Right handed beta helix region